MSGKCNCYDNAAVETFFKTIKAELIWRRSWATRRQAEMAIFEYINGFYNPGPWKTADAVEWETLKWADWFNNRRLLQPIGNIPPVEAEEKFYEQQNEFDKVA